MGLYFAYHPDDDLGAFGYRMREIYGVGPDQQAQRIVDLAEREAKNLAFAKTGDGYCPVIAALPEPRNYWGADTRVPCELPPCGVTKTEVIIRLAQRLGYVSEAVVTSAVAYVADGKSPYKGFGGKAMAEAVFRVEHDGLTPDEIAAQEAQEKMAAPTAVFNNPFSALAALKNK